MVLGEGSEGQHLPPPVSAENLEGLLRAGQLHVASLALKTAPPSTAPAPFRGERGAALEGLPRGGSPSSYAAVGDPLPLLGHQVAPQGRASYGEGHGHNPIPEAKLLRREVTVQEEQRKHGGGPLLTCKEKGGDSDPTRRCFQ